ncbi:hypothetical protein BGW38_005102 [Lunasporangiospora selenospora]|uniref:Uncharacterized protein n=1 Tax=Lunasporangiospora selenospora TaxID=979761 RepID=A0A9P6G1T9_9FUNG|nr:hypothetical protein BGW38_005102 [Lunasporangiospora selenospora]
MGLCTYPAHARKDIATSSLVPKPTQGAFAGVSPGGQKASNLPLLHHHAHHHLNKEHQPILSGSLFPDSAQTQDTVAATTCANKCVDHGSGIFLAVTSIGEGFPRIQYTCSLPQPCPTGRLASCTCQSPETQQQQQKASSASLPSSQYNHQPPQQPLQQVRAKQPQAGEEQQQPQSELDLPLVVKQAQVKSFQQKPPPESQSQEKLAQENRLRERQFEGKQVQEKQPEAKHSQVRPTQERKAQEKDPQPQAKQLQPQTKQPQVKQPQEKQLQPKQKPQVKEPQVKEPQVKQPQEKQPQEKQNLQAKQPHVQPRLQSHSPVQQLASPKPRSHTESESGGSHVHPPPDPLPEEMPEVMQQQSTGSNRVESTATFKAAQVTTDQPSGNRQIPLHEHSFPSENLDQLETNRKHDDTPDTLMFDSPHFKPAGVDYGVGSGPGVLEDYQPHYGVAFSPREKSSDEDRQAQETHAITLSFTHDNGSPQTRPVNPTDDGSHHSIDGDDQAQSASMSHVPHSQINTGIKASGDVESKNTLLPVHTTMSISPEPIVSIALPTVNHHASPCDPEGGDGGMKLIAGGVRIELRHPSEMGPPDPIPEPLPCPNEEPSSQLHPKVSAPLQKSIHKEDISQQQGKTQSPRGKHDVQLTGVQGKKKIRKIIHRTTMVIVEMETIIAPRATRIPKA